MVNLPFTAISSDAAAALVTVIGDGESKTVIPIREGRRIFIRITCHAGAAGNGLAPSRFGFTPCAYLKSSPLFSPTFCQSQNMFGCLIIE